MTVDEMLQFKLKYPLNKRYKVINVEKYPWLEHGFKNGDIVISVGYEVSLYRPLLYCVKIKLGVSNIYQYLSEDQISLDITMSKLEIL